MLSNWSCGHGSTLKLTTYLVSVYDLSFVVSVCGGEVQLVDLSFERIIITHAATVSDYYKFLLLLDAVYMHVMIIGTSTLI